MTEIEKPRQGGSYTRNKDGTLTRTGGTEEAQPAPAPAPVPPEPPIEHEAPPVEPASDTSKKGK